MNTLVWGLFTLAPIMRGRWIPNNSTSSQYHDGF